MTIDQRRDRARAWLKTIRADVQDLIIDVYIFWQLQEIIRRNPRLSAARSHFFHWMMAAHVEATVIGIRRQVKNDRRSISLRRLLEEFANYPEIVSRTHHVRICMDLSSSLPRRFHERTFDRFAGPGAPNGSPATVRLRIVRLQVLAANLERFADRRLAHYDQRGTLGQKPTFREIDACLAFFEREIKRYTMLLEGISESTLLPTFQYDWQEIFTYPWIVRS